MAIVVKDTGTDNPFYEAVPTLDLKDHITMIDDSISAGCNSDVAVVEKVLAAILDRNFSSSSAPPWSLVVRPLSSQGTTTGKRFFVAFLSSHSISDGGAGFAFHKTLLEALRELVSANSTHQKDDTFIVTVSSQPIPKPFDTPERLSVTSKLLKALASSPSPDAGIWTGSPVFLNPKEGLHTRVRLLEIPSPLVQRALTESRRHNAKLTATFHQLIVRALSKTVTDPAVTSFSSQIAIDLRGAAGVGLQWGIYVSGVSDTNARPDQDSLSGPITAEEWCAVARLSEKLAKSSATLEDQPIGLLKFVPNHRESMKSKLGGRRDGSFALSNMLAFDGGRDGGVAIGNMVVGSSAAVTSAPLSFCIVSVKGGSLMVSVNWQPGALGIPVDKEDGRISKVFESLQGDIQFMGAESCGGSVPGM